MRTLLLLLLPVLRAPLAGSLLAMPVGTRHLFVDDALLDRMEGGVGIRQKEPARVTESPVVVADAPWEEGCLVYWFSSALRAHDNPDELRYYYYLLCPQSGWAVGVPKTECDKRPCGLNDTAWDTALAMAVSHDDGDTFTKPLLNQIMWRNSTANNLVILGPVKKGTAGGEAGSAGQMEVSCHGIAGVWVAFFSRCQRYRC